MYRIVTSKKEKKNNHDLRHMKQYLSWLPTKSLCPRLFRIVPKENRKGKGRNAQSQTSHQKHHSRKSPFNP